MENLRVGRRLRESTLCRTFIDFNAHSSRIAAGRNTKIEAKPVWRKCIETTACNREVRGIEI